MNTEQLTPLDATFLELEDADASAHMHIGGIFVFDALPGGRTPTLEEIRAHVGGRLGALPRYRQRLRSDHVGRLSRPVLEDVEEFDVARQIHRAALPAPGAWEDLLELAEDFYSQRLDRTGPLWEMVLVDGLAGGCWALCTKTHHCIVDGVGSVDVVQLLLDADPAGPAELPAAPGKAPAPSLMRQALHAGVDLTLHPRHLGEVVERAAAALELLVRDELLPAPQTSLNHPIGGRRRLRGVRITVDEARAISHALGGTINDVVLTAVAGGLHDLLASRGEPLPEAGLRAMVPVNLRRDAERHALGNKITSLFVELPVVELTALERHERVRARTSALKRSDQALGSDTVVKLAGLAPPLVHTLLAQSLFGRRLFNVTVTNVPGVPIPLYAMGARLRSVYPLVPLAAEHAVGVAITSYDGRLSIGINVDHDTVPDVDVLAEGITRTLSELQRVAHAAEAAAATAGAQT